MGGQKMLVYLKINQQLIFKLTVAAWQLCHPSHPAFSIVCTAAPAHSAHMAIVAACVQHTCSILKYISRSRAVHATRRLLFCSSNLATSTVVTPTKKNTAGVKKDGESVGILAIVIRSLLDAPRVASSDLGLHQDSG